MLRWMGQGEKESTTTTHRKKGTITTGTPPSGVHEQKSVVSMRQSVYLPRVVLKPVHTVSGDPLPDNDQGDIGIVDENVDATEVEPSSHPNQWSSNFYVRCEDRFRGVNPLYMDTDKQRRSTRPSTPIGEKSSSSGYGDSNLYSSASEQLFSESKSKMDGFTEQNVKSIQVAKKKNKSTLSSGSSGTLSTIPEGRIDFTIPRPIWPNRHSHPNLHSNVTTSQRSYSLEYDSLVDEAVLLFTSLNSQQVPATDSIRIEVSVKDILVDLLNNVNATLDGKGVLSAEDMLKLVNERIIDSIEALKRTTEEEMRMLCINLRNSKKVDSVVRAFSHTSSSGHSSSQGSPEWSHRLRMLPAESEDIYHLPSSSSSGFSDCKFNASALPMFVHEDLASVPNGVRNAMIYGTLCRGQNCSSLGTSHNQNACHRIVSSAKRSNSVCKVRECETGPISKKALLKIVDDKPSVWQQYYGVSCDQPLTSDIKVDVNYVPKPTDVPIFPGGRPEADFTLDVPRSELLTKRMKKDKKWRCRCRLLTSFLGLVFFLLSVMAVSLMLTRGQRMFGSMV